MTKVPTRDSDELFMIEDVRRSDVRANSFDGFQPPFLYSVSCGLGEEFTILKDLNYGEN